jgi:hypothetical protein
MTRSLFYRLSYTVQAIAVRCKVQKIAEQEGDQNLLYSKYNL